MDMTVMDVLVRVYVRVFVRNVYRHLLLSLVTCLHALLYKNVFLNKSPLKRDTAAYLFCVSRMRKCLPPLPLLSGGLLSRHLLTHHASQAICG